MKLNKAIIELERNCSYVQMKDINSRLNSIIRFFGAETSINNITTQKVREYIAHLKEKHNSPSTINAKLSMLNKLLTYYHREGIITNKPYFDYQKVKKQKEAYLSPALKEKIIDYCLKNNQKELYQIIIIGLNTGMRISNILAFNPDTDIDNGYIRVWENKTNRPYSIPINNTLQSELHKFKKLNLSYNQAYHLFDKMKLDLDIDDSITIHSLRHTFCSDLLNKSVDLATIQKLANHSNIATTMRYSHLKNETLEKAINLL